MDWRERLLARLREAVPECAAAALVERGTGTIAAASTPRVAVRGAGRAPERAGTDEAAAGADAALFAWSATYARDERQRFAEVFLLSGDMVHVYARVPCSPGHAVALIARTPASLASLLARTRAALGEVPADEWSRLRAAAPASGPGPCPPPATREDLPAGGRRERPSLPPPPSDA